MSNRQPLLSADESLLDIEDKYEHEHEGDTPATSKMTLSTSKDPVHASKERLHRGIINPRMALDDVEPPQEAPVSVID